MLKIARPVSFLLLSVALCSSGVIFAANETTTPKVGISQQQASLKGVVEDEFGPVAGASVVVKGTTNGTVTDMNGNFVLEVRAGTGSNHYQPSRFHLHQHAWSRKLGDFFPFVCH